MLAEQLNTLQFGYAIAHFPDINFITDAFNAAKSYFKYYKNLKCAQRNSSKDSFLQKGYTREHGYKNVNEKGIFTIRNKNVPKTLIPCIDYIEKIHDFAINCLQIISKQLEMDFSFFSKLFQEPALPHQGESSSFFSILYYEAIKQEIDVNPTCPAHEDLDILTIIPKSNIPCLEVYDFKKNDWINIESQMRTGDVLVLVGSALAFISNNYYIPAIHRVCTNQQPRYSLVYDLQPDLDTLISSKELNSPLVHHEKPFELTFRTFLANEMEKRNSINYDY